ncbi:hypothetical protein [Tateyamaria sp. ANG-S1]|uniref:hypothetical protein n=1 Tax=Tateyamaria sp. ANG-S1 TaxID=1577905 RepID=UPI00057E19C8|nr:hypothetical protein [Tateyamaria sp. ANG-S1]KIC51490.1 hypothetical protein RA29_05555 [Tateyamaria sp. ANG-S1]
MPLHILLILVVGGIAGIALALHLLGLSRATPFTSQTAQDAWHRAHPNDAVKAITVTTDGKAARITTDQGTGVLWQMGADSCARRLTGTETLTRAGDTSTLHLDDYAAPKVRLTLTPLEHSAWQDWMAHT